MENRCCRRKQRAHRDLNVKGSRRDRRSKSRRVGLKLWSVLAQRQEWARRGAVVFVQKVVNEVRGKRNQVDEKKPCRQRADGLPSPSPPLVPSPGVHRGLTLSD
jgi:hypothetical protein